jgi:ABC-type Fe3+ transport system permease subunit
MPRRALLLLLSLVLAAPAFAQGPAFLFAFGSAGTLAGQFQEPHGLAWGTVKARWR